MAWSMMVAGVIEGSLDSVKEGHGTYWQGPSKVVKWPSVPVSWWRSFRHLRRIGCCPGRRRRTRRRHPCSAPLSKGQPESKSGKLLKIFTSFLFPLLHRQKIITNFPLRNSGPGFLARAFTKLSWRNIKIRLISIAIREWLYPIISCQPLEGV